MNCEQKRMSNKIKRWGLFALSVFLLGILALLPFRNAIILTGDSGILTKIPLKADDFFEVEFRHSVNKGLVIERFEVDLGDQSLSLVTGWFESYGAGMMDSITAEMKISQDRDMMRIDFPPVHQELVVYRSAGIAGHRLIYEGKAFPFHERWGEQAIRISVGRMSLLDQLLLQ